MNRIAAMARLLALLAIACGSSTGTASHASTSRSSSPSAASSTPITGSSTAISSSASFALLPSQQPADFVSQITCSGSIGASDPVAIVQLHSGDVVLRDYANPLSPQSVCHFAFSYLFVQLIDARHMVTGRGGKLAVVDLPSMQYHWFQLPGQLPQFIAVGPKLDQVSWLEPDQAGGTDKVHIASSAGDHIVASLPNPHGGRCGAFDDSKQGAYTHSGAHAFILDQPHRSLNSLLLLEGETPLLSVVPPSGGWPQGAQPAMAVWSPTSETLLYGQGGDVWKWTAASKSQRYLPGVNWLYPTITPDGNHLAYAVSRADGLHNVYLVDLAHGGRPQIIGKGARNTPAFLSSTYLWFKSESQGICGPGGNQPLIYDLSDSSESSSLIDQVFAVWPATSSNF